MCKSREETPEVVSVRGLRSVPVGAGLLHESFGHHERALHMKAIMIGEAAGCLFQLAGRFDGSHRARINWRRSLCSTAIESPRPQCVVGKESPEATIPRGSFQRRKKIRPCGTLLVAAARPHFPAWIGAGLAALAADARPARMVSRAPVTPVIASVAGGITEGAIPVVTTLGRRSNMALRCVRAAMLHRFNRRGCGFVQRG